MKLPKMKMPGLSIPSFRKKRTRLTLEIGEEWLRIAGGTLDPGGNQKITFLEAYSIKEQADLDIGQRISDCLNKHAQKFEEIILSHPNHNLTTRILSLPSTEPREIEDMIELQAVKQTPYTKDEITTGFNILEKDKTGYSRVLLAISHRDIAARYVNVTQLSGQQPTRMTLSLEGIENWYKKIATAQAVAEKNVLLLNIDATSTDFLILSEKKLVFARSIAFGASHFENLESIKNDFVQELKRSVDAGATELKDGTLEKVTLTGAAGVLDQLKPIVAEGLGKPCDILGLFEGLEEFAPEDTDQHESAKFLSFASIVGIAFQTEPIQINLIPPEEQIRKGIEDRAKDLAVLGTLLLALVTLISAVGFEKYYRKSSYLNSLKKEYKSIRGEASEIERMVAKMKLAEEQLSSGGNFLEVLRDINETIPDDIYLTFLQHNDKEQNVTMRGLSDEMSSVFQLLSTLEATPHLEFVKTRNVTKRRVEDRDVSEFEIVANIKPKQAVTGS